MFRRSCASYISEIWTGIFAHRSMIFACKNCTFSSFRCSRGTYSANSITYLLFGRVIFNLFVSSYLYGIHILPSCGRNSERRNWIMRSPAWKPQFDHYGWNSILSCHIAFRWMAYIFFSYMLATSGEIDRRWCNKNILFLWSFFSGSRETCWVLWIMVWANAIQYLQETGGPLESIMCMRTLPVLL